MRLQILAAVFIFATTSGLGQRRPAAVPSIFYIAIGSCVYERQPDSPSDPMPLFPEKIDIRDLLTGFDREFYAYRNDPATIRREDSLSKVLHAVVLSQQERAHDFAEAARITDTFPGDVYVNRCDGAFRGVKLTIRGKDTTRSLEPPIPVDTFTKHTGSFYDISDFRGAKKSARLIDSLLRKKGAIGLTISSENQPVSRNMFYSAVDSLWKIIQRAKKPNPMIIFYYCGHGYADSFGRRFLVPGTFTGELNKMPLDTRRLRSVLVKDLYKYLELAGYPFIIFLDCCSENEGNAPDDDIAHYYSQMAVNAEGAELYNMVHRYFFQPTGDEYVIYSSVLGSNSTPVHDPLKPGSFVFIGPLCRRMLLADRKHKDTFDSFENMRERIMFKGLDTETKVPGIYCRECEGPLVPGLAGR